MPGQQVQVSISDPESLGFTQSGGGTDAVTITLNNGQQVQVTTTSPQTIAVAE